MNVRKGAGRARLRILAIALAALAPGGARAGDCFAPLAVNDKWSCAEEVAGVDGLFSYCLAVTGSSGEGAARTFGLRTLGSATRVCTCGAKGKGPNARYNAANTYLCIDDVRDFVESGTITKRKLTAELYIVSENSRRTVTCRPEPSCVVPK